MVSKSVIYAYTYIALIFRYIKIKIKSLILDRILHSLIKLPSCSISAVVICKMVNREERNEMEKEKKGRNMKIVNFSEKKFEVVAIKQNVRLKMENQNLL